MFVLSSSFLAQTKSTNIQTIGGSTYYIHKIEKGQSLYSISKLYNVTLDDIYANNPDAKNGVKAGQEIKIPSKTAVATNTPSVIIKTNTTTVTSSTVNVDAADTSRYKTYQVGKKETLYAITKKFNISETELKIWNPVLINSGLKEGQVIIVGEKPKRAVVKQNLEIKPPVNPDSINPHVIHRNKKNSYNLALILPFKLEQTIALDMANLTKGNNSNFPAVPALAVDFYLGFKRAVDSLNTKDFELGLDLYDVDDKDSLKLSQLVNDPKFKQTDFIFGPLYASGFKVIAQKAKESGIPIVSPITQQNKMLYDNVYASKTNPSQFTLLENLADFCIDSLILNNAKAIIVAPPFGSDAKEMTYIKAFKKYYNDRQKALGKTDKDTITQVKGLAGVKAAYSSGVKNVIITLSTNQVFIADFTTQLAIFADKKDITLCGWQNIGTIDNIDQDYLNQLHFTFPSQNNVVNNESYRNLIDEYKLNQNTYPSEYFFIGFDIASYYLKNLRDSGPDFIFKLDQLPAETNYLRFEFTRPDNTTGFDNRGSYIFQYNNYQLRKSGWK